MPTYNEPEQQSSLPLPPNARTPQNPREYIHTAPRWFWGSFVFISTLAVVASLLLVFQLFGPSSLKVSNWFGVGQVSSVSSTSKVETYSQCVAAGGEVVQYFPDNCLLNGTTYRSSSSSQSSSSSKESQSSSSSASVQPASQTYTNQYIPSLRVLYNDSWSFSTSTTASQLYPDLVERTIQLKKNSATLTIRTRPIIPTGCGYEQNYGTKLADTIGGKYSRYSFDQSGVQYYVPQNKSIVFSCVTFYYVLNSTIRSATYDSIMKPEPVRLSVWATLQSSNDTDTLEADEIIKNSTLFDSLLLN